MISTPASKARPTRSSKSKTRLDITAPHRGSLPSKGEHPRCAASRSGRFSAQQDLPLLGILKRTTIKISAHMAGAFVFSVGRWRGGDGSVFGLSRHCRRFWRIAASPCLSIKAKSTSNVENMKFVLPLLSPEERWMRLTRRMALARSCSYRRYLGARGDVRAQRACPNYDTALVSTSRHKKDHS